MDVFHNRPMGVEHELFEWAFTALASIGDAVIVTDSKGKITFMNPLAESLTGWSVVDTIGRELIDIFHIINEKTRLLTDNPVERVIKEGIIVRLANHTTLIRKDGSETPIENSAAPIRNESGTITGVVLVFRDISERKKMDLTIQKRTHSLGERVKELNCLYSISQIIEQPDITLEMALQEILDVIPPAWQYPDITCARLQFEGQEYKTTNFRRTSWKQTSDIFIKGERIGMVEVCYLEEMPIFDEGPFLKEERSLIKAIAEDIGTIIDWINTEEALQKQMRRYKALFHYNHDAVFIVSPDNKTYIDVNQQAADLLGYDMDELLNISPIDVVVKAEQPDALNNLQAMSNGNLVSIFERTFIRKDGTTIPVELNIARVLDAKGNPVQIQSIARDITQRKRMERERKEYAELQANFISITSHELRTPLTSIQGYTELLEKQYNLDDDAKEQSFLAIRRNIKRLERFIDSILALGQIERDMLHLDRVELDLCSFSKEALTPYRVTLGAQLQEIYNNCEDAAIIMADADRLSQVLGNLLDNAIKQTSTNRLITVTLDSQPKVIQIHVKDNGAGIAPEDLKNIFKPFVSITTEQSMGGTGIGLYISQELIKAHGGIITAHSEGLGHGATFIIKLPRDFTD